MKDNDLISRQSLLNSLNRFAPEHFNALVNDLIMKEPAADHIAEASKKATQPEYEELTPEEAASELASGSTMSAWYWLDDMIRLKQMGYAICRKR